MARRSSCEREEVMIRIITSVTLASGGLAAAAYAAMGVAAADPDAAGVSITDPFGVTVVPSTTSPEFITTLSSATESYAYGNETINFDTSNLSSAVEQFFTSNVGSPINADVTADIVDKVLPGGETEQQILLPAISGTDIQSGVIDLHNWGGGYGYDYIDLVGPGTAAANANGVPQAIATFLITPTGAYDVSSWEDGGDYGDLAYQESQLFDLSNNLPDPFGSLQGTPDVTYQTGDVFANTAYGTQMFDFDAKDLPSSIQQFFTDNNVSTDLGDLPVHVIDQTEFNGLFDGLALQQISLPAITGTDIQSGVIDIENLGNGYSYDYIDLVGPGSNGAGDVGAWLVTPDATFDMSGLASLAPELFNPANLDPSALLP
jgi:hypothetical protein